MEWKITEAKNRLDEVMDRAIPDGPQAIRRGKDTVVVAPGDFEWMTGRKPGIKKSLFEWTSLNGVALERERGQVRDIDSVSDLSIEDWWFASLGVSYFESRIRVESSFHGQTVQVILIVAIDFES